MAREGFADESRDKDRKAEGEPSGKAEAHETRYEVGPGFEIAVRAALNRPLEMNIDGDDKNPQHQPPSADRAHRHDVLERRLDSVERALLIIVDQLKRIDAHLAAHNRRLPPP